MFPDGPAARKLRTVPIPTSVRSRAEALLRPRFLAEVRRHRGVARASAALLVVAMSSCTGSLSERSVAELSGEVPIGHGVSRVRIVLEDGTVGVDSGPDRVVGYRGGVRRAADTAGELARLEQIPLELTAAVDPRDPSVLVVRGPMRGETGPAGVFAFELGIRVPPDVALEVRILGNGNVTVANRLAPADVETGRGDLRFPGCRGGVRARTGRGNVIAFDHHGDLDVLTKVGDMQAFVVEPGEHLRLVTGQGTVQCHVPPKLDFELDARAETGRAVAEAFDLASAKVGDYGAVLTGVQGTGRTKIVLRTGSGHLSLSPHREPDAGSAK